MFFCCPSVCLSKYLTGHVLLNYWMDLLQIFRNYFLRSLYLQVLPLFVCLSKYLSGLLLQNYWVDWPMLASKYSVISSKYFVLVITYHFSLSFIEIIRALSQGGGRNPPFPPLEAGPERWFIWLTLIHSHDKCELQWPKEKNYITLNCRKLYNIRYSQFRNKW